MIHGHAQACAKSAASVIETIPCTQASATSDDLEREQQVLYQFWRSRRQRKSARWEHRVTRSERLRLTSEIGHRWFEQPEHELISNEPGRECICSMHPYESKGRERALRSPGLLPPDLPGPRLTTSRVRRGHQSRMLIHVPPINDQHLAFGGSSPQPLHHFGHVAPRSTTNAGN